MTGKPRNLLGLFLVLVLLVTSSGCQVTTAISSLGRQATTAVNNPSTPIPPPPPANKDTPPQPASITVDQDHDEINDIVEDELVQRFAPVIRFHTDEQYLLANIPWYLQRVRMRFDVSRGFDDNILNKGSVTISSLNSQKNKNQVSGLSTNLSDFFLEQTDANGGDNLDNYRQETRKGTGLSGWIVYAHVKQAQVDTNPDMYDIQYIFFYAYNGDMLKTKVESAHEADMEHITVRVKKDLKTVYQIYYAAHDGEGKWYSRQSSIGTSDGYSTTNDGRPIVYSAVNSHASYPWVGKQSRGIELPDDITIDGGVGWDSRQNVFNLGEKLYPRTGMEWLQYSGHWGEMGDTNFTRGPYGPAYQSWWDKEPA